MKSTAHLRWIVGIALLLVLAITPALAQGFKWWNSDQYRKELGLTSEQSKRIEEIFQNALPGLRATKKTLDDAESQFGSLVQRGDDAAVMAQMDRVSAARGELFKARTKMLLKMRLVLTTDQWIKLGALEKARHDADAAKDAQPSTKEKEQPSTKDQLSTKDRSQSK
jgi:Spy/CpxP family protein refolding chaperone